MFTEATKHNYMSAKQILEENIESIIRDEFDMDNDINTEEQSQLFHITHIFSKKNPTRKQRRQYKLNKIAFQKRAVNNVFN